MRQDGPIPVLVRVIVGAVIEALLDIDQEVVLVLGCDRRVDLESADEAAPPLESLHDTRGRLHRGHPRDVLLRVRYGRTRFTVRTVLASSPAGAWR